MSRSFIFTVALLCLATSLSAAAPAVDQNSGGGVIAGTSAAGQGAHDPAIVIASPPSPPGGHRYNTPAPPTPPTYQNGPISPLPPTHMAPYPPARWHDGHWYHGEHNHRSGWWWIVGSLWFLYAVPVYPYPDPYIPPTLAMPAPPLHNWYWCDRPAGYYPYVSLCELPWRVIPATPPPPPPP